MIDAIDEAASAAFSSTKNQPQTARKHKNENVKKPYTIFPSQSTVNRYEGAQIRSHSFSVNPQHLVRNSGENSFRMQFPVLTLQPQERSLPSSYYDVNKRNNASTFVSNKTIAQTLSNKSAGDNFPSLVMIGTEESNSSTSTLAKKDPGDGESRKQTQFQEVAAVGHGGQEVGNCDYTKKMEELDEAWNELKESIYSDISWMA